MKRAIHNSDDTTGVIFAYDSPGRQASATPTLAHYDYAPFGAATLSGTRATDNPFRFSSEFHDDTLALVYYNYRHYNPTAGRWLGWDKMEAISLFTRHRNHIQNEFDLLGLKAVI